MARVIHVQKARKDNPAVKKGQPYYHWSFRFGGKHYSATYPRPSQLTQSKMSEVLSQQEACDDIISELDNNFVVEIKDATTATRLAELNTQFRTEIIEKLKSQLEELKETITEVLGEYEEAFDVIPSDDNQERVDCLTEYEGQIDCAIDDIGGIEEPDDDDDPDLCELLHAVEDNVGSLDY